METSLALSLGDVETYCQRVVAKGSRIMKVSHEKTVIEINDAEREYLNSILFIAVQLGNEAVRRESVILELSRAGIESPGEAGKMRDFADQLSDLL